MILSRRRSVFIGEPMTEKSDKYEKRYPNTGISEAQKHERWDRIEFKERKKEGLISGRTSRFMSVPDMPWLHENKEKDNDD
jgi:hypothetical protein